MDPTSRDASRVTPLVVRCSFPIAPRLPVPIFFCFSLLFALASQRCFDVNSYEFRTILKRPGDSFRCGFIEETLFEHLRESRKNRYETSDPRWSPSNKAIYGLLGVGLGSFLFFVVVQ